MTLPRPLKTAVEQWFSEHGAVPCTPANGQSELVALYRTFFAEKTVKQAKAAVSSLIRTIRPVIQPDCTNRGTIRKIGDATCHASAVTKQKNNQNNQKNNQKNNKKIQAETRLV